jgi:hypothetical protein
VTEAITLRGSHCTGAHPSLCVFLLMIPSLRLVFCPPIPDLTIHLPQTDLRQEQSSPPVVSDGTQPCSSTYLRQERRWIDNFKQTAFDLMLAQHDIPYRFISNPSCVSTLFFLDSAGVSPPDHSLINGWLPPASGIDFFYKATPIAVCCLLKCPDPVTFSSFCHHPPTSLLHLRPDDTTLKIDQPDSPQRRRLIDT